MMNYTHWSFEGNAVAVYAGSVGVLEQENSRERESVCMLAVRLDKTASLLCIAECSSTMQGMFCGLTQHACVATPFWCAYVRCSSGACDLMSSYSHLYI
eukprot:5095744-Amphidinium_carterae.1